MKRAPFRSVIELTRQGTEQAVHSLAEAVEQTRRAELAVDEARAHVEAIERNLRAELDTAHALGVEGRLRAADLALLDSLQAALTVRIAESRGAVRRAEAELESAARIQEKMRADLAARRGEEKTLRAHEARLQEEARRRVEEKESSELLDASRRGAIR